MLQKGQQLWKLRNHHGRYKKFETPEELWKAAADYFQWCDDNPILEPVLVKQGLETVTAYLEKPRPYIKKGMLAHIGIVNSTYTEYEKLDEFKAVTEHINNIIFEQKFSYAANDVFNAAIIARESGLADKKEVQATTVNHIMPVPACDNVDDWEKIAQSQQESILSDGH